MPFLKKTLSVTPFLFRQFKVIMIFILLNKDLIFVLFVVLKDVNGRFGITSLRV
jgi:hypothetical protein